MPIASFLGVIYRPAAPLVSVVHRKRLAALLTLTFWGGPMKNTLFKPLHGGHSVVLRCNGVYTQNVVYVRGTALYAARGKGFLRLQDNGCTSHATTFWDDITCLYNVGKYSYLQIV